ncbi:ATP-binding protein [Streptomyces sp. NPDC046862]|uniref:ATP-binding protein n=1 Tax=Streptomyces sp. NPDC046862 TaxID=3154603 RepID=UPI003451AEA4
MVIPLGKQAVDQQGQGEHGTLRYSTAWAEDTVRAVDARRALHAFLAHAHRSARAPVPTPVAMDAELVVSELVTNALQHAPGPCGMTLQLSSAALVITVWDTSREEPVLRRSDRYRVGGHGLRLVHMISDRVAVVPHATGKQITALRLIPHHGTTPRNRTPGGLDAPGEGAVVARHDLRRLEHRIVLPTHWAATSRQTP